MIYAWPIYLLKVLQRWIRNFLWTGDIKNKKSVTVDWNTICSPKKCGGLGIRSLTSLNQAALLRHMWVVLNSNSMWSNLVKQRFDVDNCSHTNLFKISSI